VGVSRDIERRHREVEKFRREEKEEIGV